MAENPFAPPAVDKPIRLSGESGAGDAWQDGDVLVARDGADLGPRCVKCGEATPPEAVQPRKLQWYPRWVALLLILSPLVMLIVMLILMKRATLHSALCATHKTQSLVGQIGGFVLIFGSFAVLLVPLLLDSPDSFPFAMLGFVIALVVGIVLLVAMGVVLKPQKITNTVGYYKGVHPSILRDLPRWDGERA